MRYKITFASYNLDSSFNIELSKKEYELFKDIEIATKSLNISLFIVESE